MLNLTSICLCIVAFQGEEDRLLGKVPEGMEPEQVFFAEDGRSVVFSAKKGDTSWRVFYGDQKGPEFRSGWIYAILADGRPVYRGWDGQKNFMVVGAERSEPYSSVGDVVTSADRKKFAYKADINYKYFVVVDGKAGESFDEVDWLSMTPDGGHVAFRAKKGGKQFVVHDGRPGDPYDTIEFVEFLQEGQVAFTGRKGDKRSLVRGARVDALSGDSRQIAFGPEGKFAYIERDESYKERVVSGEKQGPKYDSVWDLRFLSDGRLLYCARTGEFEDLVLIDSEVVYKGSMGMGQAVLSPNQKRIAYGVNWGKWDKGYVVVDGKKGEEFNMVENLVWSPDSKCVAYGALKHTNFENYRRFCVVDGRASEAMDEVSLLTFGPDGKHFAFVGRQGERVSVHLDGKRIEGFVTVDAIRFSADGKRLGVGGRKGGELRWRSIAAE